MPTPVDLIVRGGTIVNSDGRTEGTIVVGQGRVLAVLMPGEQVSARNAQTKEIDATGKLLLPGGVDPHCHVDTALGEFATTDSYRSTSTAAIHGGTTTIVDFAIPRVGQTSVQAVGERSTLARDSRCSVALHGSVREWDQTTSSQLRELASLGVTTIKLFTTYRDLLMVSSDVVLAVLHTLRDIGGLVYVHAESNPIVEHAQTSQAARGLISSEHHPASRPEISERAAVAEVLAMAEAVDGAVYFVHQSTPEAVDMVTAARSRGVRAFSETCTHYLTLDASAYDGPQPEKYVCCPPLRKSATVRDLQVRMLGRGIDTIGSDHCCFHGADKARSAHDVRSMPYGMPGVEMRLPVIYSEFVHTGKMSVERFVELTATMPARLNGLSPRKGSITAGSDADFAVWDPHAERTITLANTHSGMDYEPYEGLVVHGWPSSVIVNGKVALDDGTFIDPGPAGAILRAAPIFGTARDVPISTDWTSHW